MKRVLVFAVAFAVVSTTGAEAAGSENWRTPRGTFDIPRNTGKIRTYDAPKSGALYEPAAPRRRSQSTIPNIPNIPGPQRFKPYGDRSGMRGGGPGAYPSAPKLPGYIDLYGNDPDEHPFAF